MRSITSITTSRLASYLNSATTDPLTLWINWCGPRGSVPDPQGQSGDPEGPAVKARVSLTSKERICAYRQTHPGDSFCWSTGSSPDPQGQKAGSQGLPAGNELPGFPKDCFPYSPLLPESQWVSVLSISSRGKPTPTKKHKAARFHSFPNSSTSFKGAVRPSNVKEYCKISALRPKPSRHKG